jgi:hypothetical protein
VQETSFLLAQKPGFFGTKQLLPQSVGQHPTLTIPFYLYSRRLRINFGYGLSLAVMPEVRFDRYSKRNFPLKKGDKCQITGIIG